jgi:outer membrane protein
MIELRARGRAKSGRTSWRPLCGTNLIAVALSLPLAISPAAAETIFSALARAYYSNPDLNSQRATVRAQDEGLPKAKSGYLPTLTATGSAGYMHTRVSTGDHGFGAGYVPPTTARADTHPRSAAAQISETIFNGGRTVNSVRQADSLVLGARETMRNTEQNVLNDGVTFYMNVLRDTAVLELDRNNVTVLQEQLRQTKDRFQVGEVTRTDVAQAEASLAQGQALVAQATATLKTSIANYRQTIGVEPKRLEPARPAEKFLPGSLNEAIDISQAEHPAIQAALHGVDSAALQVKIAEGGLYPTANLTAAVEALHDANVIVHTNQTNVSLLASISVPIYDGGLTYATTRQAKEQLGVTRLQADLQRDRVRAAVQSSWAVFVNSAQVIQADQAQVNANEIALNGVREEAKVGQRTTLDVLNAQQALLNSRVALIGAQRDRVVASYSLLSSIGRLSADTLSLPVERYDPQVHYEQVKDKWWGLRTPDGQ